MAMEFDTALLDAIAGRIDAPAPWRFQFALTPTFNRWSIAMIEGEEIGALAYFWVLSNQAANESFREWMSNRETVSLIAADQFDVQEVIGLDAEQAKIYRDWQFARVGETVEEASEQTRQMRDGTGMNCRFFDGQREYKVDLTNPGKEEQPLRYQANQEVFEMLAQTFDCRALMDESNPFKMSKRYHELRSRI